MTISACIRAGFHYSRILIPLIPNAEYDSTIHLWREDKRLLAFSGTSEFSEQSIEPLSPAGRQMPGRDYGTPWQSGRVFAFIGAKGGVGTTTTALNVAVALAMQGKSVILAELRPSFGTLAFHLPQLPARSLRTLLDLPPDRVGQHELNAVLCKGPAGLWILLGPKEDEEEFREVDPLQTEAIIRGLSRLAEYVVLDLPPEPTRFTQVVTNLCHFAAVVTERESASVQAGKVVAKNLKA